MARLTNKDIAKISKEYFEETIPFLEENLSEVFKKYPVDENTKHAILNSLVVSQKASVDVTMTLISQLVNSLED